MFRSFRGRHLCAILQWVRAPSKAPCWVTYPAPKVRRVLVQGRHNQFQPLGSIFFTRSGFTRKGGGSNSYGLLAPTVFKTAAGAICRLALPLQFSP